MSFQLVKLVSLSRLPSNQVNGVSTGPVYKFKSEHITSLNDKVANCRMDIKQVRSIDNFNRSNNLMPSWKSVKFQLRQEEYVRNIGKYTEPLLLSKDWNVKTIGVLNNVWKKLYEKNIVQSNHPILTCDEEWMTTCNYVEGNKRHNLEFLTNQLVYWKTHTHLNFNPLFNAIRTFKQLNVTDFSATGSLLTVNRNTFANMINNNIIEIKNDIVKIEFYKKLKLNVNNEISFNRLFTAYDFESVFPYDKLSASCLDAMHKAATQIEGGVEFIKNSNGSCYTYFDNPIGKQIISHRLVDKCGHSGMTFIWTVSNLCNIYKTGWDSWVNKMYNSKI